MHVYTHPVVDAWSGLQAVPTAMKSAYFSGGQNCAGGERFFIQDAIYDQFLQQVCSKLAADSFASAI